MRLFLASQDFGNFGDRLSEMIGSNRRALVVFNAHDYRDDRGVEKKQKLFLKIDLEFNELDLRDYFGKGDELRRYVDNFKPGAVIIVGGNTFLLRRALAQSGFDKILIDDIRADKYVYAGYSAGSMIVAPSLEGFNRTDNEKIVASGYDPEVIWSGLGLIDIRIIPHVSSDKYRKQIVKMRTELFDSKGWRYELLGDEDVFVVDGEEEIVLRGVSDGIN